ncbi:MAG: polysaccharide pyruvyl transferase family protein, partial [Lachnospiraceae bacterium]|nr:polysaccharide pyruvyl transferase family protein [Lachnospiraceae bacterium]
RWKDTGRVLLVDDDKLNARQLKYIISNCSIFVGARPHATVAAYSTGVPTLAIGYSVKARGIARDLFGSEENMVIPIADLIEPNKLIDKYQYIYNHQSEIHSQLGKIMPEYKKRSRRSLEEIAKLVEITK